MLEFEKPSSTEKYHLHWYACELFEKKNFLRNFFNICHWNHCYAIIAVLPGSYNKNKRGMV